MALDKRVFLLVILEIALTLALGIRSYVLLLLARGTSNNW